MELRQLEYFLAVAEELHFGRAASRLHISQPPLTVHIKRLEQELGVQLFERTSRRVALTPEGTRFRDKIQPIMQDLSEAVEDLKEVSAGRRGRVRVGFVSSASYELVPAIVRDTRKVLPGVHIELHPMTSGEQIEAMLENKLDFGIIRDATTESGLKFTPLLSEQMVAVLPSSHRLAARDEITPEDLTRIPLVLFPFQQMPGYVNNVLELFHHLDRSPVVAQQATYQENVMGLVSAGVGASILPESFSLFQIPGVITRPITTQPHTQLEMVSAPERQTATAEAVISVVLDTAQKLDSKLQRWVKSEG